MPSLTKILEKCQIWRMLSSCSRKMSSQKKVTVSNLEGSVEALKNDSLQYQKTISALESELEEEKKKCQDLEKDLTNQGQDDSSFLEESVSPLEEVEHDDKTEDKETVVDELIKVEVAEGSSFSGQAGAIKLKESRKSCIQA